MQQFSEQTPMYEVLPIQQIGTDIQHLAPDHESTGKMHAERVSG
jgi:hypothetical protein